MHKKAQILYYYSLKQYRLCNQLLAVLMVVSQVVSQVGLQVGSLAHMQLELLLLKLLLQ